MLLTQVQPQFDSGVFRCMSSPNRRVAQTEWCWAAKQIHFSLGGAGNSKHGRYKRSLNSTSDQLYKHRVATTKYSNVVIMICRELLCLLLSLVEEKFLKSAVTH